MFVVWHLYSDTHLYGLCNLTIGQVVMGIAATIFGVNVACIDNCIFWDVLIDDLVIDTQYGLKPRKNNN